MYFILDLDFSSNKSYIKSLIIATAKSLSCNVRVYQDSKKIYIIAKEDTPNLDTFLKELEINLPASIFLEKSSHYFSKELPKIDEISSITLPLNIALCPNCQKEMFDISSNRYYYPFTSCNSCGGGHSFLIKYPYKRENTLFNFFTPCSSCKEELKSNPFRENYPLISCIECGVALCMRDKKSERFANSKGEYKRLFEVATKALSKGKTILVKTINGYRKFYKISKEHINSKTILMVTNANRLNYHFMLIPQEFNTLLSIERPLLRVATKSNEIKEFFKYNTLVKYPDEGMSILLAKELLNLGFDYIGYEEAKESVDADFLIDFNLPLTFQKDCQLFVNQDVKLFIDGKRVIFPMEVKNLKKVPIVANNNIVANVEEKDIIDLIELFDIKEPKEYYLQKEDRRVFNTTRVREFDSYKASTLSVIAQNSALKRKVIGISFEDNLRFLYYNGSKIVDVLSPSKFKSSNILSQIRLLREGSDRLVENFKAKFPKVYNRLMNLDGNEDIFRVIAIILELKQESLDGISSESLGFLGKGGVQIDMKLKDSKFDYAALLASIMSYKIAGVENSLICYSLYESFGDYIGEIVPQIAQKVDTKDVAISGVAFANQPLFARVKRNLALYDILLNKNLPLSKESSIYGAIYL